MLLGFLPGGAFANGWLAVKIVLLVVYPSTDHPVGLGDRDLNGSTRQG